MERCGTRVYIRTYFNTKRTHPLFGTRKEISLKSSILTTNNTRYSAVHSNTSRLHEIRPERQNQTLDNPEKKNPNTQ